jgi:membrane protease YdiL (CAAX protease family)
MVISVNDMLPPETPDLRTPNVWLDRLQALFEVVLVSGLVSSLIAALPFALVIGGSTDLFSDARTMTGFLMTDVSVTVLFLLIIIGIRREAPAALGLRFDRWISNSLIGLAVVPLLFIFSAGISAVFQAFFPEYFLDRNPLTEVIRTPGDLALISLTGLIAGGVKEELQRAFILNRFQRHLGGATVGLVIWSAAFGAGHYVQGAQGVAAATIFGVIFGLLYLARNSLIAPIVAHGAYNTLAILWYWFAPKLGGSN